MTQRHLREHVIRFILVVLGGILGYTLGTSSLAGQASDVMVIVNASNPAGAVTTDVVEQFFLKRVTVWPTGQPVVPVDLPEDSPVRESFSAWIHGRSTSAIESFWRRQVFSGRTVPPVRRNTAADVVTFVASAPGGIGYVPAGTALPPTVRVLRVVEDGSSAAMPSVYEADVVDELPEVMSRPPVRYPLGLLRDGVEGSVVLEFTVRTDGRVDPTSVIVVGSSDAEFEQPAIEALLRTVFRPGRRDGAVVAVRVQQRLAFTPGGPAARSS